MAERSRVPYLDWLRLLAAFAVVMIHVSAQNWENVALTSWQRQIFALYNTAVSWPVNLFVMLTGLLFLDPDRAVDTGKLYTRQIPRLLAAFFFWSAVYALRDCFLGASLRDTAGAFLRGHFHQWYLWMAAAFYTLVPVFRPIAGKKSLLKYFLGLTFFWIFLIPGLVSFLTVFQPPLTGLLTQALASWRAVSNFGFHGIFVFYFAWGLYLHRYGLPEKVRRALPLLALLGYLGRTLLSTWYIRAAGTGEIPLDFALFDLPVGTAVFLLGKQGFSRIRLSPRGSRHLRALSGCTFGCYLIHPLVMYGLQRLGLDTLSFHPALSVPLLSLLVTALSLAAAWLAGKLPLAGKYIV